MNAKPPNEETLLEQALTFTTAEARLAYLQGACGGDEKLQARVRALIDAHEAAGGFLADKDTAAGPTVRMEPQLDERPGTVIGRYKLLQQIGEGGCGTVYMAEQEEPVRRRVALKVVKLGMDTKSVIARFEAERQALALMDHPNIAKVLDAGATETGRPYFVMELVRGIKITDYCDQNNLPTKERLNLFVQVCHAIEHAHQKGIIHRDIKPSNVLVSMHDGVPVPVVIDFGIAKATEQRLTDKTLFTAFEQFIGTPAYTSPEQAEMSRLDIDTRSDIYSLGVLLYELLTGKTPFDAKELLAAGLDEMRRTIREKEPARPSTRLSTMLAGELTTTAQRRQADPPKLINLLRGDLDWIVMKALEKDRTRRYETANGFAQDIERHLNDEPVAARPPSTAYRLQKAWRRNRLAVAAGAAVAAALLIGTGVSLWQAVVATRAKTNAVAAQREAETISKFMTEVFLSPDPERDGRTITVAEALDAAAKKLEADLANQPARRAQLQAPLGSTYFALGLYRDAIPLQKKVWDYHRLNSGPEHPATLKAMDNLAVSYAAAHRPADALKLHEEALALSRKVLGLEHPDTIGTMHNLAITYWDADRRADALKLHEEVLTLRRKVLGPEHPDTLKSMCCLGVEYAYASRHAEAVKLHEEALVLSRKVNGAEHPGTITAMSGLAISYSFAGRRAEALKLHEEVLTLRRKVHGPAHPNTLAAISGLASSYVAAGRPAEALKLREEVLALSRVVLGAEDSDTRAAMSDLASSYADANRPAEALKLREEVLALTRKVLGPGHPDTLRATNALKNSYAAARRAEAIKLGEDAVALSRQKNGPEHPDTLGAMHTLANAYAADRPAEALKLREEVLTLRRKLLGPEHPDTVGAMENLASSYLAAGRVPEGLPLLEEASAKNPNNTISALRLAALQVWFGKEADHSVTCERMLQWAAGTNLVEAAERAAKITCLRSTPNAPQLERALVFARRAVETGKTNRYFPWYQLTLGMVEYRTGQYSAADRTLMAVRQSGFNNRFLQGTAGFYRTMSLFRQGKLAEARQLFAETEAKTKPLPDDENKPLAGGATHDDLILWLAFKEAKAMLESSAPAQSNQRASDAEAKKEAETKKP